MIRRGLGKAAHLILALGHPDADPPNSHHSEVWQHIQQLADTVTPDSDLCVTLNALTAAPARVQGHYLLAILQWIMSMLRGRTGRNAKPQANLNVNSTPAPVLEETPTVAASDLPTGSKRTRSPRKGADPAASLAVSAVGVVLAEKEGGNAQQDARLWWLLAALLGCEGLPVQEVPAPALLKPLLAACQLPAVYPSDTHG